MKIGITIRNLICFRKMQFRLSQEEAIIAPANNPVARV